MGTTQLLIFFINALRDSSTIELQSRHPSLFKSSSLGKPKHEHAFNGGTWIV